MMDSAEGSGRTVNRQSGFTLVEVLAALALSSLILVALNLAMTTIRQGSDGARSRLSTTAELTSAAQVFSDDVARIAKIRLKADSTEAGYWFDGSAGQMVYPLTEWAGVARPALYLVRLRVAGDERRQLIRERAPLLPGEAFDGEREWRDPVVLLDGDYDVSFAYRAPRSGSRTWSESWEMPGSMPEQISITVTDRKTGRMVMPLLVQPLAVDGEVECAAEGPSCAPSQPQGPKP
jgi:prepilin-type N-terminal cleavage/methylation domain-containing protein